MLYGKRVFNFHIIKDVVWFENIIKQIKKRYTPVGIEDIENYYYGNKKLRNTSHITFDDGHKTLYDNVFPIIKKHNIPISVYVSPKIVSENTNYWFQDVDEFEKDKVITIIRENDMVKSDGLESLSLKNIFKSFKIEEILFLVDAYKKKYDISLSEPKNINLSQMLEMQESGLVVFGSHTVNHPILPNESDEVSEREILESIKWLSDLLGKKVKYFSYPNGDCTERDVEFLKKHGIKNEFSAKVGKKFSKNANPLLIPRVGISYGSINYILAKMMFGGYYWDKLRRMVK